MADPPSSRAPISKEPTARCTPASVTPRRVCGGCSANSPSRAASRATWRPRRRDRSTRAASSATPSSTPMARSSTTRTCWLSASSATARPKRARSLRAGTRTSFSTRSATGPCCRSSTSTATRSPAPPCSRGSPQDELRALLEGYGYAPRFVEGDDPASMHQLMAATLDEVIAEIAAIRAHARTEAEVTRPRWPMIVLRSPKGLDRAEDGRRPARRGQLPLAPGAAFRGAHEPAAPRAARAVDALLQAGGAVRGVRRAARGAHGAGAGRRAAHGRQPARQRRPAAARPRAAGLQGLRRRGSGARQHLERGDARARNLPARRHARQRRQLPRHGPRRNGLQPPRRAVRGDQPDVGGASCSTATITSRPTGA